MAARTKTGPDEVAQLATLLNQGGRDQGGRGRGRRSPLARWLRRHHDAFTALLDEQEPGWEDVATALAAMGLRDGDGKPPTGERVRKAWWGVRREIAHRRAKTASRRPASDSAPVTLAVPPDGVAADIPRSVPVTPPAETTHPKLVLDIRPAIPLGSQVSAAAAATPVTPPASSPMEATNPSPAADVEDHLRRLREQMQASKVPVPRIVD